MKELALKFVNAVERSNRFIADYCGYLILPLIFVICYEVISRKFFNKPTIWALEVAVMIFGTYILFSGGPSLLAKAQVRMDALHSRWRPRTQAIVDSITFIGIFTFCAVLTFKAFAFGIESWEKHEISNTPLGQPLYQWRMLVAVGTAFLLLQTISDFVKSIWLAVTGERLKEEEVKDEPY